MSRGPFPGLTEIPPGFLLIPIITRDNVMKNKLFNLLWKLDVGYTHCGVSTR